MAKAVDSLAVIAL